MSTPDITLNNGVTIPVVGFGVYQTPPDETKEAVTEALRTGYRHIDTAAAYGNERGVGEAIADSGLERGDVFVETKIWISDYGYDETLHAFEKATGKLGLDHLDLLILHQPLTTDFERTIGAYKALEKLLADGKVRAIGVSNFMVEDLDRLAEATDVAPSVNQIEMHPYFQQREVIAKGAERGILAQAWSPIGGVFAYGTEKRSPLEDPVITEIADAHGKTPAQVILRWHIQEGRQVIPKSVRPARIAENFDLFGVELSDEELGRIDDLETGTRGGPEPSTMTLEAFGRPIPEA
ncbi:oxidoreductase [Brachybacterium endophyticum]|uniref:Oxidoreductase n=1 Tax=Brachybacterium endophyticum TaxID=2182385 RepID=A0A2U2RKF0_9MICO|nr:aldo/keto reductase [Brachybacterium endophyticum]PWH06352.1 oxidoreductase [Brachybacterium endophyticum]